MKIDARKAEVKKIKIKAPLLASQKLALSLYGPVGFLTSEEKMYGWKYVIAVTIFTIFATLIYATCFAFQTEASYYTVKSCLREGTSGIMANGRKLDDSSLICASWDYPFNTVLRITNRANGRSVDCVVSDRGPSKRLYRKGRKIDLSYEAMRRLDGIKSGLIQVTVEVVK